MVRGEIYWAEVPPPYYRRPVCVITRDHALPLMTGVVCAMLTTRVRGVESEVPVPSHLGLKEFSVISCDNLATIDVTRFRQPAVGVLDRNTLRNLDAALVFALGIEAKLSA